MTQIEKAEIRSAIETQTGFHGIEEVSTGQCTYYGTSAKFTAFKTAAKDVLATADLVILMDTNESKMYSAYTKQFY